MRLKRCFKCGVDKPLGEFYRHPQMGDGFLGKCKSCTKSDVRRHREENIHRIRAYDRSRGFRPSKAPKPNKANSAYAEKYPEKKKAHTAVSNAIRDGRLIREPCEVCGGSPSHAHHDDYSRPLDVRWLCVFHHHEHHKANNELNRMLQMCGVDIPEVRWS